MPVTELAILRLAPGVSLSNEDFRVKLLRSKQVMETALGIHGRRFVYYQDAQDPMVLYVLGDWQSTEEHWNEFIPSPENQELLALLKHDLDIPRIEMYHVDLPAVDVPTDASVISIKWHEIRQEDKAVFERSFYEFKYWLDESVSRGTKFAGGWRVERAPGQQKPEEFVLFCGWETVDEHLVFAKTKSAEKYGHIRDIAQEYTVKYGIRIDF